MDNITVKAYDGSTDVVYTARQPSSGDGVAAVFQNDRGEAPAHRAELRITSKAIAKGTKRLVRLTYMRPSIAENADTGVTSVIQKPFASAEFTVNADTPTSDINEAAYQFCNLMASAVVKGSLATLFAPR